MGLRPPHVPAARPGPRHGSADRDRLEFSCSAETLVGACTIGFNLEGQVDRSGDALAGRGEWRTELSGLCGELEPERQTLELVATRTSTAPAGCGTPKSLTQILLDETPLVVLAAPEDAR